jgi:hypothetical protein
MPITDRVARARVRQDVQVATQEQVLPVDLVIEDRRELRQGAMDRRIGTLIHEAVEGNRCHLRSVHVDERGRPRARTRGLKRKRCPVVPVGPSVPDLLEWMLGGDRC